MDGAPWRLPPAVATVAVTPLQVTLDGPTLAMILDGIITTWLDRRIVALNPNGILMPDGDPLTDTPSNVLRDLRIRDLGSPSA